MPRVCPDCPAVRRRVFEGLVHREAGCAFRCVPVAARQPFSMDWRADYGFALVRRGIVVRQRTDYTGRATSIDIAGPGSTFPIGAETDDGAGGYAVDDAMLCLCPSDSLDEVIGGGATGARDVVNAQVTLLCRPPRKHLPSPTRLMAMSLCTAIRCGTPVQPLPWPVSPILATIPVPGLPVPSS